MWFSPLIFQVPYSSKHERVQFPNLPNMLANVVNLNFKLEVVLVTITSYTFFWYKILYIGDIGFRAYSWLMAAEWGLLPPWQHFLYSDSVYYLFWGCSLLNPYVVTVTTWIYKIKIQCIIIQFSLGTYTVTKSWPVINDLENKICKLISD